MVDFGILNQQRLKKLPLLGKKWALIFEKFESTRKQEWKVSPIWQVWDSAHVPCVPLTPRGEVSCSILSVSCASITSW